MEGSKIMMTDPARELVELCEAVRPRGNNGVLGEAHLAAKFDVQVWSREFFQILFVISERIDFLISIINNLDIDEDYKGEMIAHAQDVLRAFSGPAMRNHWEADGEQRVSATNLQALKGLSPLVRREVGYKKLSEEEITATKSEVAELLGWLGEHQLVEQDFLRQALIDGLRQFEFRVDKLKWLGWGYALDGLKDVIAAYVMLERQDVPTDIDPNAEAILRKVGSVIKSVYTRVQTAKDVVEGGDFLLKAYGAGSAIYHGASVVTALIGSG